MEGLKDRVGNNGNFEALLGGKETSSSASIRHLLQLDLKYPPSKTIDGVIWWVIRKGKGMGGGPDWVIWSLDDTISIQNKMGMRFIFLASSLALSRDRTRLQLPLSPTMTWAWEGPRRLQGFVSAATKEEPYGCCGRSRSHTHVRQVKFLIEKRLQAVNILLVDIPTVEKPTEKPAASVKAAQIVMFWW
ncbi:hypothetical protein E3N88_15123 [Mikania micrantha]|uniref:Uncharacterized protein n=1 Tax=Mikania micrantha TaxID=192012 RepID=A0A5N6NWT7_9ASTR|nr:hypothetical protein E3N88_15123 [Mikania micrantha]